MQLVDSNSIVDQILSSSVASSENYSGDMTTQIKQIPYNNSTIPNTGTTDLSGGQVNYNIPLGLYNLVQDHCFLEYDVQFESSITDGTKATKTNSLALQDCLWKKTVYGDGNRTAGAVTYPCTGPANACCIFDTCLPTASGLKQTTEYINRRSILIQKTLSRDYQDKNKCTWFRGYDPAIIINNLPYTISETGEKTYCTFATLIDAMKNLSPNTQYKQGNYSTPFWKDAAAERTAPTTIYIRQIQTFQIPFTVLHPMFNQEQLSMIYTHVLRTGTMNLNISFLRQAVSHYFCTSTLFDSVKVFIPKLMIKIKQSQTMLRDIMKAPMIRSRFQNCKIQVPNRITSGYEQQVSLQEKYLSCNYIGLMGSLNDDNQDDSVYAHQILWMDTAAKYIDYRTNITNQGDMINFGGINVKPDNAPNWMIVDGDINTLRDLDNLNQQGMYTMNNKNTPMSGVLQDCFVFVSLEAMGDISGHKVEMDGCMVQNQINMKYTVNRYNVSDRTQVNMGTFPNGNIIAVEAFSIYDDNSIILPQSQIFVTDQQIGNYAQTQ